MKRRLLLMLTLGGPWSALWAVPLNQITQNGITWSFCGQGAGCPAVEAGQFANGDWYVVGPLTIQSVNPPQAAGRNGSWVNPGFNVNGGQQPFDDRVAYNTYNAGLRPTFPLAVNSPISLLSSVSQTGPANCAEDPEGSGIFTGWRGMVGNPIQNCNRSPVKDAAVLTVLTAVPPPNSFRPPYSGTNKTIQFNKSQLDYSKLAQLVPTAANPPLSAVERLIERVNIQTNFWSSESVQPVENSAGYGRDMTANIGLALLAANMNYPNSLKETLVVRLVQMGIDFKGVFDVPGQEWYGLGGHGSGRGWVIKFAGDVLNNPTMAQIMMTNNPNRFGELSQTFAVANYPAGTPSSVIPDCANGGVNCGWGGYDTNDIGLPEWGFSHWHDGPDQDGKDWMANSYRRCCTANAWNGPLLASYMMDTEENVPLTLRAYTDRYMQTVPNDWTRGWHPLFPQMWDAYRNNYSRVWDTNDLCTEGTSRPAPLQAGVCSGAQEVCTLKNWWGGNPQLYSAHSSFYQQTESACDGRDNDCDGQVDEGCAGGNLTPQVNAGPNRAIVWPADTITIGGTASDDGRPNPPGVLTYRWTFQSGPGTVAFGTPNSLTTTATFSEEGVYVLRLTVNDSLLSAFDDMQVTVSPPGTLNTAPQVDAGVDRTIMLTQPLLLIGTGFDDGLPNPPGALTVGWSRVNGPGPVDFNHPTSVNSQATFSVPGLYRLRLTASDGALSAVDDMQVLVQDAQQAGGSETLTETKLLPCLDIGDSQSMQVPCIRYQLKNSARVQISLYSRDGKLIRTLRDQDQSPGSYTLEWDGQGVAAGLYNVVLKADGKTLKTKVAVLK